MVIIAGKNLIFNVPVSIANLKKYKEIYIEWSHPYETWHKQKFKGDYPQITISIMTQLKEFMAHGDSWAIVPISIANKLSEDSTVRIIESTFDIPNREISVLTAVDNDRETVKNFFECIKKVTKELTELNSLI